ncbi:MAG: hypothetical protein WBC07_09390 [Methylotenera sp.]
MSRIDNDEYYDDVSQQIKINAVHRDVALLAATDLLNASQQNLNLNLNFPISDLMIASHALITQREYAELKTWPILNDIALKLEVIAESIDCAGVKPLDFWMQSDIAAIDKANELGISILPEYSMADLRYKIYCAINEVI